MSLRVVVKRIGGDTVCEIDNAMPQWCGRDFARAISTHSGICACKIQLLASEYILRVGTPMKKIRKWIQPDCILYLSEKIICATGTNATDLYADGFCLKCMRLAGVQAVEILAEPGAVNAVALRDAGFSLDVLVRARERLPRLRTHPPVTERTLFDSQLKAAGFSASDFHSAGFKAQDLSYKYFWKEEVLFHERLTVGEIEWEQCCAFFEASELREAGYTASELQHACFSIEDLQKAGFTEAALQDAVPAKARPGAKRRRLQ